jgi:hypothetical protein
MPGPAFEAASTSASVDAAGTVYEYLDGQMRDRTAKVARFQEDRGCG